MLVPRDDRHRDLAEADWQGDAGRAPLAMHDSLAAEAADLAPEDLTSDALGYCGVTRSSMTSAGQRRSTAR